MDNSTSIPQSLVRQSSYTFAPLTFQQEWVWDMVQRYNCWNALLFTLALRLSGALDLEALRKSFEEIIRRNGALRTAIVTVDGVPTQRISELEEFHLEIASFVESTDTENEKNATRSVEEFFEGMTDPAARFFKVKLIKLSDREHVLAIAVHHIISDACSLSLMSRELWLLYSEYREGRASSLEGMPAQYADYALWQRQTDSAWLAKHGAYWKERLSGATGIRLPVAEQRDETACNDFTELKIAFDERFAAGVRESARRQRVLPALFMFAVHAALVSRWCGQRDLILPFATSGRHLPEHVEMHGFFSYFLYLRIQLTGNETFSELLSKACQEYYAAFGHQDFTRISMQAPELFKSPLFNWVSGNSAEISGLPAPSISKQLGDDMTVGLFPFLRRVKKDSSVREENAPVIDTDGSLSITFRDNGCGFDVTLGCMEGCTSTAKRFAQELRLLAEWFIGNPQAQYTAPSFPS